VIARLDARALGVQLVECGEHALCPCAAARLCFEQDVRASRPVLVFTFSPHGSRRASVVH
jgi:hypothetical protein